MARLNKQYYYTKNGEKKINCYHITITKNQLIDAEIDSEKEIKISIKNKKIIIEQ